MKDALKLAVGVLIGLEGLVTLIFLPRVSAWWWNRLTKRTRVIIALAHVAVIGGVGVYVKLG